MAGPQVKRITGVLYAEEALFTWVCSELGAAWGAPEAVSDPVPFVWTDYYKTIAPCLLRRFICFGGLQDAGGLADWKRASCALEARSGAARTVNIDPGYVDGARLVLASTKDHAHRIYLRDGIYAEVTLRYRFKKWTSFDYTFPDFARGLYDRFLTQARQAWLRDTDGQRRGPGDAVIANESR